MVLFMVAGVTLLTGCKPDFLTINNLHALRKGMSRAEVGEALPKEATMTRSVTVKGIPYTVDDFPLQTAQALRQSRHCFDRRTPPCCLTPLNPNSCWWISRKD